MTEEELIQKILKRREYIHEWRNRPGYKEKEKQAGHKRYMENKEKVLKQSKLWQQNNREKTRQYSNAYREKHPEHQKNWIRKNPVRYWAYGTLSCHKKRGYEIKISRAELEEIGKKTLTCHYCGVELDYSPLKGKQAKNSPSLDRINNGNLIVKETIQIICQDCNRTKSDRTHLEFIEYCQQITNKFASL